MKTWEFRSKEEKEFDQFIGTFRPIGKSATLHSILNLVVTWEVLGLVKLVKGREDTTNIFNEFEQ